MLLPDDDQCAPKQPDVDQFTAVTEAGLLHCDDHSMQRDRSSDPLLQAAKTVASKVKMQSISSLLWYMMGPPSLPAHKAKLIWMTFLTKLAAILVTCRGSLPLEKGVVTNCSIFIWWTPWREEPAGLQSMGSQRVRHEWATNIHTHTHAGGASVKNSGQRSPASWTQWFKPYAAVVLGEAQLQAGEVFLQHNAWQDSLNKVKKAVIKDSPLWVSFQRGVLEKEMCS